MIIQRILNNNVVIAYDMHGEECIIVGKGVGFQKKTGGTVDKSCIEKVFHLDIESSIKQFKTVFNHAPEQLFNIVLKIVDQASYRIDRKIHKSVYAALLDHLCFALDRAERGIHIQNMLLWDIKRLYKAEFEIGLSAIRDIKRQIHIELQEDEAASIALHLLNAQQNGEMPKVENISKIIQDTLNIVKYHFKIEYEEDSINFQRFITHLKFFAHRLLSGAYVTSEDSTLHDVVATKYNESYACAKKINKFISHEHHRELTDDEMMFLSIHIEHIRK